jgi:hypothetical protein
LLHRHPRQRGSGGSAVAYPEINQAQDLITMRRAAFIIVLLTAIAGCVAKDHEAIATLIRHITRGNSPSSDFDSVRRFIQAHSVHRNNDEVNVIRKNGSFVQEVLKHVTGERSDPVPMLCGARARLEHDLIEAMGYDARVTHIFDADSPASHTFTDVMNPITKKWETSDPDLNIFWRNKNSRARIAVTDYAPDRLDEIEPCNDEGCGWDVVVEANKLRGLFDRVAMDD